MIKAMASSPFHPGLEHSGLRPYATHGVVP